MKIALRTFIAILVVHLLSPQLAFAEKLGSEQYAIYRGQVSGSSEPDIYLYRKPAYVVIGTKASVVVEVGSGDSYVMSGNSNGTYNVPVVLNGVSLDGLTRQASGVLSADFNADGVKDLFIQGSLPGDYSVTVQGASSATPSLLAQVTDVGGLEIDQSKATLSASDVNGDGYADILVSWVIGGTTSLINSGLSGLAFVEPGLLINGTTTVATSLATPMNYRVAVDDKGQSTMIMPIVVNDGIAEHQPRLSLVYSSGGSRRLMDDNKVAASLGYGWSVTGIPEISRCRYGEGGEIALDSTDALCFGGERLYAIGSGVAPDSWADTAVFRIDRNPNIKVVAAGSLANQTREFIVYLPGGRTQRFGQHASHRVSPAGSNVVYSWKLVSDTDDYGNVISYQWLKRNQDGIAVPLSISYAGAEVHFRYVDREDAVEVNVGEANVPGVTHQSLVLDHMFTTFDEGAGAKNVGLYRFDTKMDSTNTYRRLDKVQRCGYNQQGGGVLCQEPLHISWITGTNQEEEFNNVVSRIENGFGRWDEFDYELISGQSGHPLYLSGCELCYVSPTASPAAGMTLTYASGRLVAKEHRMPSLSGGSAFTKSTFKYDGNARYGFAGEGFVGFLGMSRTRHDVDLYQVSNSANLTHDITTYRKFAIGSPYYGRMPWVDEIVESSVAGKLSQKKRALAHDFDVQYVNVRYIKEQWEWNFEDDQVVSTVEATTELCNTLLVGGVCQAGNASHTVQSVATMRYGTDLTGAVAEANLGWGIYSVGDLSIAGEVKRQTRTITYDNDLTNWVIGFVERIEIEDDTPSSPAVTQVSIFAKDGIKGKVKSATSFPADATLELTSTNTFDANGEVVATLTSGVDVASRSASQSNLAFGRYPQVATDAYLRDAVLEYDYRFGKAVEVTNVDNQTASVEYNHIGLVSSTTSPTGDVTTVTRTNCDDTTLCNGINWGLPAYVVETNIVNGGGSVDVAPTQRVYLSINGSVLLQETEALKASNGWRRIENHYDERGRSVRSSLPYFSAGGATPKFTDYLYDEFGRIVRIERPDGSYTQSDFTKVGNNLAVTTTELVIASGAVPELQFRQSIFDAAGQLSSTTDGYSDPVDQVQTTYTYTSLGLLDIVKVNNVVVADLDYDAAGNRTQIVEPNTGTTTFEFSALGEVLNSADAKNQQTSYKYDLLGRLFEQGEGCSGATCATIRSWTYDASNGYGQLATATGPGLTQTYVYTPQGLLDEVQNAVSVSGFPQNGTRTIDYSYSNGRVSSVDYPGGQNFTYEYSRGYLKRVKKDGVVLDEVNELSAFGGVANRSLGNGLVTQQGFDPNTGALISIKSGTTTTPASIQDLEYKWRSNAKLYQRKDKRPSTDRTETYEYDALNRLESSAESSSGRLLTFDYDAFGNIKFKNSNIAGDQDVNGYAYTNPHRLNGASIAGVWTSFGYDNNGNITSYSASGTSNDKAMVYDANNRLTRVSIGAQASPAAVDDFWYGPDGQRFLRKASWQDNGTTKVSWTLYLLGGAYEEVVPVHDASTTRYYKVQVSSNVLSRVRDPASGANVSTIEYLHRDHLGSVDVVTNSSKTVLHRTSFDPFGGRRAGDWSADLSSSAMDSLLADTELNTSRGYTDHEMLDRTGFVHMNGRVYDGQIGRFLQPDPFVTAPTFSQSYNRYAYVYNSPLSYTDPSGYVAFAFGFSDTEVGCGEVFPCEIAASDFLNGVTNAFRFRHGLEFFIDGHSIISRALRDFGLNELGGCDISGFAGCVSLPNDDVIEGAGEFAEEGFKILVYDYEDPVFGSHAAETVFAVVPPLKLLKIGAKLLKLGKKFFPKKGGRNLPFTDKDRVTEINKTLDRIDGNGPFPHKRDGITFKNREGKLPDGNYKEYTVDTPGASNRGARRVVRDQDTGNTYYTDDHYKNFIQIDPTKN